MPLNSKSKMAITALVDLSLHQHAGPVSLVTIAHRQQISLSSLEQVFLRLRQAGIVRSVRGPGGGYSLNHKPANLPLRDVAELFESSHIASQEAQQASAQALWLHLKEHLLSLLGKLSLQSLIDQSPQASTPPRVPVASRLSRGIAPRAMSQPVGAHVPNSVFNLGNLNQPH